MSENHFSDFPENHQKTSKKGRKQCVYVILDDFWPHNWFGCPFRENSGPNIDLSGIYP
jgi:hypothetical protein